MRCDRFRSEMMKTKLASRTRAERALFFRHAKNCTDCWNWLIEISKRYGGSTAEQLSYPPSMLDADNQDKEFLEIFNKPEIIESWASRLY